MKASDLRVGNFIRFNNLIQPEKIIQITPIFFRSSMEAGDFEINNYYNPIPLTEEWLMKLGFEKESSSFNTSRYYLNVFEGYVKIMKHQSMPTFVLEIDGSRMPLHNIKHVHELQNLYFSLTGEELPKKPLDN